MDGSWLLPWSKKNIVFDSTRLFGIYLFFPLKALSLGLWLRLSQFPWRREAWMGKMIELALPSISSADELCPSQRSCHSNLSVIFGPFVVMDFLWLRAKQFSEVFTDCSNVSTAFMTSLKNIPVDVTANQKSNQFNCKTNIKLQFGFMGIDVFLRRRWIFLIKLWLPFFLSLNLTFSGLHPVSKCFLYFCNLFSHSFVCHQQRRMWALLCAAVCSSFPLSLQAKLRAGRGRQAL